MRSRKIGRRLRTRPGNPPPPDETPTRRNHRRRNDRRSPHPPLHSLPPGFLTHPEKFFPPAIIARSPLRANNNFYSSPDFLALLSFICYKHFRSRSFQLAF